MSEPYVYIGENAVYWSPETKAGLEYLQRLGEEETAALFDKAYRFGPAKFSDGYGGYFFLTYASSKCYRISLQ